MIEMFEKVIKEAFEKLKPEFEKKFQEADKHMARIEEKLDLILNHLGVKK